MNLQPMNGYVLLRPVEAEEKTAGGLYVPATARKGSPEGIVEAVASDAGDEIAIGDRVLYKEYSGDEIEIDGQKYRLVQQSDLLAKFAETDAIPD